MKKVLYMSTITVFLLLLMLFIMYNPSEANINLIPTDRIVLAKDFEQLEEVSEVILRATILPNKETKLDTLEDGSVKFGYTITKLRVNSIIKGELDEGDSLKITEEYYAIGNDLFIQGNYMPAKENKEYVFFLKKHDDSTRYEGMYYPVDLEKGKYSLDIEVISNIEDIDQLTNEQLGVFLTPDKEYKDLYKKVINKYGK